MRIKQALRNLQYRLIAQKPADKDVSAEDKAIIAEALKYSMTSFDRIFALMEAVRHVERRGIPGAFVECGVWRGGSVLAMLRTLLALGVTNRDFYLYDTFEGMTAPTEVDVSAYHGSALTEWKSAVSKGERAWDDLFNEKVFNEEDVRRVLLSTGYPSERLHFVKGMIEQTIPATVPDAIAVLRLDTDWYESTRHEMQHLYPLIPQGGVLVIDDYGHWDGCRKAIDEYFSAGHTLPMLLNRVGYSCRIGVKEKG